MIITKIAKEGIKNWTKKDVVVVWGGIQDEGRKEATNGFSQLKYFVRGNSHTNIIQMCVPHRSELHVNSCVSNGVDHFNRIISNQIKAFKLLQS
jgi:hypothetical protein